MKNMRIRLMRTLARRRIALAIGDAEGAEFSRLEVHPAP